MNELKCKHCSSGNTIDVLVIEPPIYHIDDMDFIGDKTVLCRECGRISIYAEKWINEHEFILV